MCKTILQVRKGKSNFLGSLPNNTLQSKWLNKFNWIFIFCLQTWLNPLISLFETLIFYLQTNLLVNTLVPLTCYISGQLPCWHFIKQHLSFLRLSHALIQSHGLRQTLMFGLSCYDTTASCSLQVHKRSELLLTSFLLFSGLLRRSFYTTLTLRSDRWWTSVL